MELQVSAVDDVGNDLTLIVILSAAVDDATRNT